MTRLIDDAATAVFAGVLVAAAIFLLIPVVMTVVMSFDGRDYLGRFPPPSYSLRWYRAFVFDSYYMNGLRNSVLVSGLATGVAITLGVAAAVLLDRYAFPGRDALAVFLLSPIVVPTVVTGFSVLLFLSALGVSIGLVRLVLGHVIIILPYTIRTVLASLGGIKPNLTEAALTLGADERRAFWSITFPLARVGVLVGAVLAFALSFEEASGSLFLYDPSSYTLPVAILGAFRSQFNLTLASASVVMMAVTAVLLVVLESLLGLDKLIGTDIYRA